MGISLIGEAYLLYHLPSLLLALMYLAGRSDCSFLKTLNVGETESQYYSLKESMARLSHPTRSKDGQELWATPRGESWMPEGGGPLRFGVLAEQAMEIYGSGPAGVRQGDVVIDCGADIGMFTRSALEQGASFVVAVEPAPEVLPSLRRNFEREAAAGRVVIYPKGVWNKTELLPIYGNSVVARNSPITHIIQLTTIDSLVDELALKRVDFIKMDIEGAERQALEGARRTLTRFKPRLAISSEHSHADAKEIPQTVHAILPTYVLECGPCVHYEDRLHPFVLYFH